MYPPPPPIDADRIRREHGGVLVEFALVALVLYLLVAGGIALSRGLFMAQMAQEAARFAARELALVPLPPGITFEAALRDPRVAGDPNDPGNRGIYSTDHLVIDLDLVAASGQTVDAFVAQLPTINRALRPLMIFDAVTVNGRPRRLLRMPGALLSDPIAPSGLTVAVPLVVARADSGAETIRWLDVLEEVRVDPDDPTTGSFAVTSDGPTSGLVAVRVNVAFQAAGLSAYRPAAEGRFETNAGDVILADDGGVTAIDAPPGGLVDARSSTGYSTYEGSYGLGRQAAFGRAVRPFRRVITGQALFRRELFAAPSGN